MKSARASREDIPSDSLRRLAEKYRALAGLKSRREEAEAAGHDTFPPEELAARIEIFRSIAGEFPGSLRELEISPAALLLAKAERIEAALKAVAAGSRVPVWIAMVVDYHDTLRESLAVKFWLSTRMRARDPLTAELLGSFIQWHEAYPHRHGILDPADRAFVEKHRRPPRGRILDLVRGALSERYGVPAGRVEAILFEGEASLE